MTELPKEWAFLRMSDDEILFAEGPFTSYSTCPLDKSAIYFNHFDLSLSEPWLCPKKLHTLDNREFTKLFPSHDIELVWKVPSASAFSEVFSEISSAIQSGILKKSVPVASESSHCNEEQFLSLPRHILPPPSNLIPYGFFKGGEGFIGASPEYLFRSFEGKIRTMALAGTATPAEREVFCVDQKEIQEHEFVAETLLDSLTPLGMIRRHDRKIHQVGSLIHFLTEIEVELYQSHNPDDLIKHFHPTPALGPLPRTSETLEQLYGWRNSLDTPAYFGAPFGLYHEGHLDLLVAIRMSSYQNKTLQIPAGCGTIEASRLTNEWRELSLKRNSVKKLLKID